MDQLRFQQLLTQEIEQMCRLALVEDLGGEWTNDSESISGKIIASDITAALISPDKQADATLITRENGILCGTAWVNKIFELLGSQVDINWQVKDGDTISAGQTLCVLKGNARAMLTGERSAMNFLQTFSATATLTAQYVAKVNDTQCQLLDTRKTLPGMRFGQKYAVKCGGGSNHRMGLFDAFLIKENHIMACGGIENALAAARLSHSDKLLEIEVESLVELEMALNGGAQVIMLDNFELSDMRQAVEVRNNHSNQAKLEASGNVSLETIANIAKTGVDFISVGGLTKNIKAIDLSLRVNLQL